MIIPILSLLLIISLGIAISSVILNKILITKNTIYEEWIREFKQSATNTLNTMREIDKVGTFATSVNDKGTFESDDQVGQIFREMSDLVEKLNEKVQ